MKLVKLVTTFLFVLLFFSVKAQGLGRENKPDYLESQKPISWEYLKQNSSLFKDKRNSLDNLIDFIKLENDPSYIDSLVNQGISLEDINSFSQDFLNKIEMEKTLIEQDVLLKAQTNKPNSKVMEDVSFWDAYGKSFVKNLVVLISIMIGFALLKLLIKGFKKLRKIKIKDLRNYHIVINFKEKTINYFKRMNSKDIITFSIILGVLVGLCFGYLFGDTKYLIKKGLVVSQEYYIEKGLSKHLNKYFNFNYIIGVASFIITTGVSYLYLNKKDSE